MTTISEALKAAAEHHRCGRLQAAGQLYRQILQADPDQADALYRLGLIAHQVGQSESATSYFVRAIGVNGEVPAFHNSLGAAYRALGRADEAVACFRRALELKPDHAEAHFNLGNALKAVGNPDEAAASYRRALALKPDFAAALNNLGNVCLQQRNLDEAAASYRRSLELNPSLAETHNNLGNVFWQQGKLDEAIVCCRRALALKPDYADVCNNLAHALREQGNLDEAVACARRAIALRPDSPAAHCNLGNAFLDQKKVEEAADCYQRALALKPDCAEAHSNLGNVFRMQGNLDEAVASARRALALKPDLPEAHISLGSALEQQGKPDEAEACYRRALALKPADTAMLFNNLANAYKDQGKLVEAVASYREAIQRKSHFTVAHSNLLVTLHYCPGIAPAALSEAHAEYDRQHAAPLRSAIVPHERGGRRPNRLRLGFVSPDLGRHPVGSFFVRVLEHLRSEQVETTCYSDRLVNDDLTARLRAAATHWRDVHDLNDEQLAAQIRTDRIDILFDLAGHTADNRLLVFARRPAPVQIGWIGYPGSTGVATMDYLIADPFVVPDGAETDYRERILRLPQSFLCFDPPADAPPAGPLPAQSAGHVTFGSFNNPAKLNDEVIALWSEILAEVPGSRLILKYSGLGQPTFRDRLGGQLARHGIRADRLELQDRSPLPAMFGQYQRIDIALDPFPFGGGMTTCLALWMGLPVITLPRETFASRQSLSLLSTIGVTETIATTREDYREKAVALAHDRSRLAGLRASLRAHMLASPGNGRRKLTHLGAK